MTTPEPSALAARVQHLTDALRPFVDGLPATEAAKMVDKRYRGFNPIQIVVTKFQYRAAKDALK
jgi:hypothetical protein